MTGNAKDIDVDLMVARKLTNVESRSFVFSDQLFEIIEKNSKNANDKVQYEYYKKVIYQLADFGKYSYLLSMQLHLGSSILMLNQVRFNVAE